MSTKTKDGKTSNPEAVKAPRLKTIGNLAGPCPQSERHENTKVYTTKGQIRYCRCDDCGHTWKLPVGEGHPLASYLLTLADSLETAPRIKTEDGLAIVFADEEVREISEKLREFVTN